MMLQEKIAATGIALSAGGAIAGSLAGTLNEYLQMGAFCVAMISGLTATVYYLTKICRKE